MLSAGQVLAKAVGKRMNVPARFNNVAATDQAMGGGLAGFAPEVVVASANVHGRVSRAGLEIGNGGAATGLYIPRIDDKVTVGVMQAGQSFAYSDGFGGCDLTILRNPQGRLIAAHVYSSNACRSAVAADALPAGWMHVYTWRSRGYITQWEYASVCCLAVLSGRRLKIVALRGSRGTDATLEEARISVELDI